MTDTSVTCWTLIAAAASGDQNQRDSFARRYGPVAKAYLGARWRGSRYLADVEDAVQEVFLECLKEGGALERVGRRRPGGFRAFLYGITRNVAARVEERRARRRDDGTYDPELPPDEEEDAPDVAEAFDRAWAAATVATAVEEHARWARDEGDDATSRVELLRLRFHEGLPIREIAAQRNQPAEKVHRDYARARREFAAALRRVVSAETGEAGDAVDRECRDLMMRLQ